MVKIVKIMWTGVFIQLDMPPMTDDEQDIPGRECPRCGSKQVPCLTCLNELGKKAENQEPLFDDES